MKVILIKDVARLGLRNELVNVPDGHALNFLIPRKLAVIATPEGIKRLTEEVRKRGEYKAESQKAFEEALKKMVGEKQVLSAQANEKGSLFKGVNASDIEKVLAEKQIPITREDITLAHPLKELGVHEVPVARGGITGSFQLEIVKK